MTNQTPENPNPQAANNLRDVLMEIRSKRGALTAEIVVEEASDPLHPLHHRFEWDDDAAAHKWRLHQAGQLLRVRYKADVGDNRADLRAFWVVRGEDGAPTATYEPIEEVIMDDFQRTLLLKQMRRDWQTFRRRYEHMEEFVGEILADLGGNDKAS